jgi:hypothetical protein
MPTKPVLLWVADIAAKLLVLPAVHQIVVEGVQAATGQKLGGSYSIQVARRALEKARTQAMMARPDSGHA